VKLRTVNAKDCRVVECRDCGRKVTTYIGVPDGWVQVGNALRCRQCQILARLVV
jgi:hypothetical protein